MNRLAWLLLSVSVSLFSLVFVEAIVTGQNVAAYRQPQVQKVILVDDFAPQPLMGDTLWYYNRLGGDRGEIKGWWEPVCQCVYTDAGYLAWGQGVVTATITQTQGTEAWVGGWTSLNHVIAENKPLNFGTIFPTQILTAYQGSVIGLRLVVVDGSGQFQVELQAPNQSVVWSQTVSLTGGPQILEFNNLPLGDIRSLNWLVKGHIGDFVVVDQVELDVTVPQLTTGEQAFLWSYGMLLSNWDADSGLTRDRANFPSGDFDNVSASGLQAAAAVQAWYLGMISLASATEIVSKTTASLLVLPDCNGLWPHFVTDGQITQGTEWSSVDTVIAMVALIEANQALGLTDSANLVAQELEGIEWNLLVTPTNRISHGFDITCTSPLPYTWYDFGTETWLANFGYAAATGNVAEMDPTPPTYNGSGFIDELAWLLVPAPDLDRWLIPWNAYRNAAADAQIAYYQNQQPPHPCYAPDLFGLSAAEVPDPSIVMTPTIYQPFGVGGETPANDGTALLGHAVLTPHYPAMISALRPQQATTFWTWLETQNLFTPLNNVESLMFIDEPTCNQIVWNALKGSWNLGLQTLGWGNYLLQDNNPLYETVQTNPTLYAGYQAMLPETIYLPLILRSAN